jgi:cytidylate kinase
MKIGVVGPCGAGKSSLIAALKQYGYNCRHIVQEHSYVPEMWRILSDPDVLVFLDVSYEISTKRRNLAWTIEEYKQEVNRLQHARKHADIYIDTDHLTPKEILEQVLASLKKP